MGNRKTDTRMSSRSCGLICTVRGVRVMLDRDLATIYGVATRVFNQAVKRNKTGFRKISCFSSRDRKQSRFVVQDHKM